MLPQPTSLPVCNATIPRKLPFLYPPPVCAALLPRVASCRICLEKSDTKEMEQPCACKGTMQVCQLRGAPVRSQLAGVTGWRGAQPGRSLPLPSFRRVFSCSTTPLHPITVRPQSLRAALAERAAGEGVCAVRGVRQAAEGQLAAVARIRRPAAATPCSPVALCLAAAAWQRGT